MRHVELHCDASIGVLALGSVLISPLVVIWLNKNGQSRVIMRSIVLHSNLSSHAFRHVWEAPGHHFEGPDHEFGGYDGPNDAGMIVVFCVH